MASPHRAYGAVLAQNIRAARARLGISQDRLAARMRALGYEAWLHQTVSNSEKGRRRLLAEELPGLSLALETTAADLVTPDDAEGVELPGPGLLMSAQRFHINDRSVTWDGDVPTFSQVSVFGVPDAVRGQLGDSEQLKRRAMAEARIRELVETFMENPDLVSTILAAGGKTQEET